MSERPTEADVSHLLDLAAKATPGPWKSLYYGYVAQTEDSLSLADADRVEDADYIAAANPKAITALAMEVLRLRARRACCCVLWRGHAEEKADRCERCGRPMPTEIDYEHAAECAEGDCEYGKDLCWGHCTLDDEVAYLRAQLAEANATIERLRRERNQMARVNSMMIEMTDWLRRNFSAVGEQWDERWRRRTLADDAPEEPTDDARTIHDPGLLSAMVEANATIERLPGRPARPNRRAPEKTTDAALRGKDSDE